jgi:hypothetical protein
MKKQITIIILFIMLFMNCVNAQSKVDKFYELIKNDGTVITGQLITEDIHEIQIKTKELGDIAVPKHELKSIKEIKQNDVVDRIEDEKEESFSTRYFLSTNALPIKKGDDYIQWNIFGPDFQFAVGKNVGLGIMTSWFGTPVIGSVKYSMSIDSNLNFAMGALVASGSWINPSFGFAVPFGAFTIGNRKANINFSGGYGAVIGTKNNGGRALLSIGGMMKVSKKITLIFDSFISPSVGDNFALLIPGIRWQSEPNKAFQFGFTRLTYQGETAAVPIPTIQWYRKL